MSDMGAYLAGAVIILVKAATLIVSLYLFYRILTTPQHGTISPSALQNTSLWALLAFFCILDPSATRFGPFLSSEFVVLSGGFPNMSTFRIAMYSQLIHALASVMVSGMQLSSAEPVLLTLLLSVITFFYVLFNVVMEVMVQKLQGSNISLLSRGIIQQLEEDKRKLAMERGELEVEMDMFESEYERLETDRDRWEFVLLGLEQAAITAAAAAAKSQGQASDLPISVTGESELSSVGGNGGVDGVADPTAPIRMHSLFDAPALQTEEYLSASTCLRPRSS